MQGKGDRLARGDAKATFQGGYGEGELKPSIAKEGDFPSVVDNSALFAPKRPAVFYKGQPFNQRVLVTRVEMQSNSSIIIPDPQKRKVKSEEFWPSQQTRNFRVGASKRAT